MKTMQQLETKDHALEKNEIMFDSKTSVQEKGFSFNFIIGFLVFLYKTAIKP